MSENERPVDGSTRHRGCSITIEASKKRRKEDWVAVRAGDSISSDYEIEILVTSTCRAQIDITPDRANPQGIDWKSIEFLPKNTKKLKPCTRYKVAYYRAKEFPRPTRVTFTVTADCGKCDADCPGTDSKTFVLRCDDTA